MHFADLGSDASIRKALSQLQKRSFIRRLAQGLYDYPKKHDLLGIIPPDVNEVAKAIAEKDSVLIQFQKTTRKNMLSAGTREGLLIQALKIWEKIISTKKCICKLQNYSKIRWKKKLKKT